MDVSKGGIAARSDWGALARDACDALVVKAIASGPNSPVVLPRLWGTSREALLRGLVALYDKDANNISRVLDVCQVCALKQTWHNIYPFYIRRGRV